MLLPNTTVFALPAAVIAALIMAHPARAQTTETSVDGIAEWDIAGGFDMAVHSEGFAFPTSLAFVPNPGSEPDDPLYFVTELRGRVKIVSRDGNVKVFAEDFFQLEPEQELPDGKGQAGLAGICLAPEQGYVFVTFAYEDAAGVLRNNIVRFQTEPQVFASELGETVAFTDIFASYESGLAHQIGNCHIEGDFLYVGIGDGWQPQRSRDLDDLGGKVIRMTLDGNPAPGNPHLEDNDRSKARNYVWAYGFRNPFGLYVEQERVVVAENGHIVDRFVEIEPGRDYLWAGDDRAIASNADFVWTPSASPVQMDRFVAGQTNGFETVTDGSFFVAIFAQKDGVWPGVQQIDYDMSRRQLTASPRYFVRFNGERDMAVTAVALGPDGLYFAPLYPDASGASPVYRVFHDPDDHSEGLVKHGGTPQLLIMQYGCNGCHEISGQGGHAGEPAPVINAESLTALYDRLHSDAYLAYLEQVENIPEKPLSLYADARDEVRSSEGWERVRTWVKYRIMEPRFDTRYSQMPSLGVPEQEAEIMADFLLKRAQPEARSLKQIIAAGLPKEFRRRDVALVTAGAFVVGFLAAGFLSVLLRRRKL